MRKIWWATFYSMAVLAGVCFFGQFSLVPTYITVTMALASCIAELIALPRYARRRG